MARTPGERLVLSPAARISFVFGHGGQGEDPVARTSGPSLPLVELSVHYRRSVGVEPDDTDGHVVPVDGRLHGTRDDQHVGAVEEDLLFHQTRKTASGAAGLEIGADFGHAEQLFKHFPDEELDLERLRAKADALRKYSARRYKRMTRSLPAR